jgi:ABC-type multidrug transport system fused ATPase/permease subunit
VAILNIQIPQDLGNMINSVYNMLKSDSAEYDFSSMYKPALDLIKLYILQSTFTFSYIYLLGVMGENMAADLKTNMFSKLIRQDISFYDNSRTGELIDR